MSIQEALYNSETKCVEASCLRISLAFFFFLSTKGQRNVLRGGDGQKKNMTFEKRETEGLRG